MSTVSPFSLPKRSHANSNGWLGIDFGSAAIKVVQLRRRRGQLECLQDVWLEPPNFQEEPDLPFGTASDNFSPTAIVTSMSWVEMEVDTSWDVSGSSPTPLLSSNSQDCSAVLAPTVASQQPLQPRRVSIVPELAHWLGSQFLQSGYEPKLIDAPPWTLSRALTLFDDSYFEETGAILDWSATSPLLVIQHRGLPQFARTINCGGLAQLTETLRQRLNLDLSATTHYLHRLNAEVSQTATGKRQADWTKSLITPLIQQLADELNRSMNYLRWQCRELLPKSLIVSGGAASIPMLVEELQLALDIPIQVWRLPSCDGYELGPIAAQAAALSALEWLS